jgi:hypothetical protein
MASYIWITRPPSTLISVGLMFLIWSHGFVAASAQSSAAQTSAAFAHGRITQSIDQTDRVTIPHSIPQVLGNAHDLGRMGADTRLENLLLILKSSPEQEHALSGLLDQQQDKTSPNYHHWLTPDEFGSQFGITPGDLQKISGWLKQQGFVVGDAGHGHTSILFSASVAQVEQAFHTEIHRYTRDGEQHFSNSTEISIPSALAPVISGVTSLNDFKPRPAHVVVRRGDLGTEDQQPGPFFSDSRGHSLSPADFSVIYKTQSLLGQNFDGTGTKIGVLSLSNINPSDVQNFRNIFFPGRPVNVPALFTPGGDPGRTGDIVEEEADLDLEWSGAAAPGATIINFASTSLDIAARYAVDTNFVDIISVSFGSCEAPASDIYQGFWAQAAAQGITVFVSTGDSGAASCDAESVSAASKGYAVNRLASTPFNVAVGGTEFRENGNNSLYWSPTNGTDQASALSYIPEVAWNESCSNGVVTGNGLDCNVGDGIGATGGGVSFLYSRPSWQVGPGVPTQDPISVPSLVPASHRYIPDVSLSAAGHDGYLVCTEVLQKPSRKATGDCSSGTPTSALIMGGTSAATPAFAGIQAIIDQKYGRQGQAAYVYYNLAAKQNTGICNSTGSTPPDPSCVFNDITSGSNGVPCVVGVSDPACPSSGLLTKFSATTGYDLATGLGSVNATNLFNQWQTATPRSTALKLQVVNPASRIVSVGQPVTFSGTLSVPDGAWGPPPTGAVTFSEGATQLSSLKVAFDKLSLNYVVTFTMPFSVAGTHIIQAQYGDSGGVYLGSTSSPVSVFVQQTQTLHSLLSLSSSPATVSGGQAATLTATLDGPAPSGGASVAITDTNPGTFPAPVNFTILPGQTTGTSVPITAGNPATSTSVTVTGTYNGASKTTTLVVNPASKVSLSISLSASQVSVTPGQTVTFTAVVSGAGGAAPTGLLSFQDVFNGVSTLVCSQALIAGSSAGQYTASCSEQLSTTGLHALAAIYNGDAVYGSAISNVANVMVQQQQSAPVLAGMTITPATIAGGVAVQGAVTLTGPAPPNATVTFDSSDPHFVPIPQPVSVTQGFNSRAFPVATAFTSGVVGATITAHYNGTTAAANITVLPVAVSGVTFFPSTVTAGIPAAFTVFLTGPAAAGTFASLTSSDPSKLQVPGTVALSPGATSVSFTGTTFSVDAQTTVTLTAGYNLSSSQATLTLVPVPPLTLNTFVISPATVTGGVTVSGTVGLTAPAPSGGVNVTVSSASNLIASTTVTVPDGSVFAPFSLTTSPVNAITDVAMTASFGGVSRNGTVTLVPPLPFVASLSFSPSTVSSGLTATGTLTLTAPAPLGGVSPLLIAKTQAGIAIVPFNVNVPAGSTSANFSVRTSPIGFIAQLPVTSSFNGTSASSVLTIVPPGTPLAPAAVAFDPFRVTGGTSSSGTIALTAPAPSGGALVSITSDNSAVGVPPSVTVPGGASGVSFTVTTSSVPVVSTATVTVSLNGISQSTLLTLVPAVTAPPMNAVPSLIDPLNPLSQTPGLNGSTLTVNGSGFVQGAQIFWNGTALPTTFVTSTKLQASTRGSSINQSAIVAVKNPGPVSTVSNTLPAHLTFAHRPLSFTPASLAVSNMPFTVVSADLNRDSNLDLIVVKDLGVSVFLGNGDGTFGPELILPATATTGLVVADFNGDGKPDIAVVTDVGSSSTLRVFLGNGDGDFTTLPDIPLGEFASNPILVAGDVNGDGSLDLALSGSSQAKLLLGNGDGTFRSPVAVGTVNFPPCMAMADLNADGKLDLILCDIQNMSIATLLGNGDGSFQAQKEYKVNGNVVALVVADFDGDGHPDIAVANEGPVGTAGGGAAVVLNNGDGTFGAPTTYAAGQEFFSIATDDIDGDGKLDLVVLAGIGVPHAASIFLGNGAGTFTTSPVILPLGIDSSTVTIADINNDGAPDLLITNVVNNGDVSILIQSKGPVLQVSPTNVLLTVTQGDPTPTTQLLMISNTGDGQEQWSVTASQPWVTIKPTTGSAPSQVNIGINPTGLVPGTYNANVVITALGAANSPVTVPVILTVNPAPVVVSSISFSSSTISAPTSVTGTVTLNSPAQGTASVALLSDNSAVQVPATVTVPAGLSSATFSAITSSVPAQTVVNVTASFNGVSTNATLTLLPGLHFVPVPPCRVADTRNPNGPFGGPFLSGGVSRGFTIPNSACGIPSTAQAYSLNATVVPHATLGFLTMFPCGQSLPLASTLNSIDGRVKAGAVIVPAGTSGGVCAFPTGDTDLILDINGYFVPAGTPSSLAFYPVTPCRLVDTRGATGALGGPALVGNAARAFPILSSPCSIPNTAQAYSLNYTSVPQGKLGFLTTWPTGQTQPLVSTLNAPTGTVTANAAIVPAGTNGEVSVFVTDDSNLVIDINGYFAPPGPGGLSLFPLTPCRVTDTRNPPGSQPFIGTLNVDVIASGCGAAVSAQSYVLNATVVPPGPLGFLTLWPQGATQPLVSTLNAGDGAITSNMAIVPTTNGSISAFVTDKTHLVLDISGYFAP